MSDSKPNENQIHLRKERVFLNNDGLIVNPLSFDSIEGTPDIPQPIRKREEYRSLSGNRNVYKVAELGFDPSEKSLDMRMMTAIFLMYAIGSCKTDGTDLTVPETGTLTNEPDGSGYIIQDSAKSWSVDQFAGKTVVMTSGDEDEAAFYIVSNTATELTCETLIPDGVDLGDTFKIVEAPYTHTIEESNSMYSFGLHIEQNRSTDPIYVDLLGCLIKTLTISIEQDAILKVSADLIVCKWRDMNESSDPVVHIDAEADLDTEIYTWADIDVSTSVFTYNSVDIMSDIWCNVDMIEITIENDIEMQKVMCSEFPTKLKIGQRDYTIKMHVFPQNKTLYEIMQKKIVEYSGVLALTLKFALPQTDYYWQIDFDNLYLSDYPNTLPSWEDKILGVDIELKMNAGGTCVIESKDKLDGRYYEDR